MDKIAKDSQTINRVLSADGTTISYCQIGSGPCLVVLHGGGRASQHYRLLAESLSSAYTVIIPDRRGRGLSGGINPSYGIEQACQDVTAVMQATNASMLFGHSAGGLIALEVALSQSLEALMVYEPGVSINGSLPVAWLPGFEQALAQDDPGKAMAIFLRGLQINWMSRLPRWVLTTLFRAMTRGPERDEIIPLLHTLGPEIRMMAPLESKYERYRRINVRTLLMGGSKSPEYLRSVLPVLEKTIPQARLIEFAGLDHSSPEEEGAPTIASAMREWLSSSL